MLFAEALLIPEAQHVITTFDLSILFILFEFLKVRLFQFIFLKLLYSILRHISNNFKTILSGVELKPAKLDQIA